MRTLTFGIAVSLLISCGSAADLEEGSWTGSLSPMNHPEAVTALRYEVAKKDGALEITLIGPDSTLMPTRSLALTPDTLYFVFDEPEEGVALGCALARTEEGGYEGRCKDAEGKWAAFTMVPPKP